MSNKFPLSPDTFSGGSRLTAQQDSEGVPLYDLLNQVAVSAESAAALTGAIDYSAATAAVVAAANRGLTTNAGANRTVTLPTFATAPDGWEHTFMALDGATQNLVVAAAGADTINGVAGDIDLTTANHEWVKVFKVEGATGWYAIGGTTVTPA